MASNSFDNASPDAYQRSESRQGFFESVGNFFKSFRSVDSSGESFVTSDKSNLRESTDNQLERAQRESSRILNDITGSSKGISVKFFGSSPKPKRIPRLYYINNRNSILLIIQGDITRTKVDAIVNAANEHMTGGSGVDGMVHRAAGNQLYKACKAHKQIYSGVRLPTGQSRILLSYDMGPIPYYIINTAGPMYDRRDADQCAKELSSCYRTALSLAALYDLESIGFTAISCGIFGYPADDGAEVALESVDKYADSVPVVVFVLWDDHIYDAWVKKLEELKFDVYDPETPIIEESAKSENDDGQKKTTENPNNKDVRQSGATNFNLPVIDLSTTGGRGGKPEDDPETLLSKLPSVPKDAPDTQPIDGMDQDNTPTENNSRFASHRTVSMTDVDSQQKDAAASVDPEHLPTSEGTNISSDNKSESSPVAERTEHSNDGDRD